MYLVTRSLPVPQLPRYRTKLAELHAANKITLPADATITEWAETASRQRKTPGVKLRIGG
jgi:hypothetical protein